MTLTDEVSFICMNKEQRVKHTVLRQNNRDPCIKSLRKHVTLNSNNFWWWQFFKWFFDCIKY